jgi:hypothetical protein
MWDNPNLKEAIIAGAASLAATGLLLWAFMRFTSPPKRSKYSHSLESRLLGVASARLRELERLSHAQLQALPERQRDDRVSPSGRRFYIETTKRAQPDGTLAITVSVVEIKPLGLGKRVAETLYASPPHSGTSVRPDGVV